MINENMVFKLAAKSSGHEISLSSVEWGVITQIDGEKTVGEIAGNLALSLEEAFEVVNALRKKGLIFFDREIEVKEEVVGKPFLQKVNETLTKYIGPVAQYLIHDVLTELRLEEENIPKSRLPEFIEILSDEISDEKKKVNFQREMLSLLKQL
ncbi:hypothetical protein [Caldithrix abyssi]|uniref:DUF8082 domain-containing protein n=1 Tax=Caldithrix abyssi DSM 13497 TaxID=880073 RepID=H1XYV3_CALAY|nr:hypothetical protein [Caldithrix abyssi]APF17974.1 hypothetical protein Cabys_1225 [Caldithrix abyssi DSM 13497]EHO42024.1 hypothetical protein Calab_2414 [Caldithrix abyssi DSM 13497]